MTEVSAWSFWQEQLAGNNPETTPGTPHQGYYINRNRQTYPNPNPRPGDPRNKVKTTMEPCAIWHDADGWHCVITGEDGPRYTQDVERIDYTFSRCCRQAIGYDEYRNLVETFTKEPANV